MPDTQQYAYLSKQIYQEPNVNESYADRQIKPEYISPDGHKYWVIARASNSQTGYQGYHLSGSTIQRADRGTPRHRAH